MDTKTQLGLLVLAGLALGTACGGSAGTCTTDAECGGDFICNHGQCQPPIQRTTAGNNGSAGSASASAGTTGEAGTTTGNGGFIGGGSTGHGVSSASSSSTGTSTGGGTTAQGSSSGGASASAGSTTGGSTSAAASSSSSSSSTGGGSTSGGSSTGSGTSTGGGLTILDGGAFVTVPLNGCPMLDYNAPVNIGGQTFQLTVDTGSTDTAVALSSCSSCGVSPEFSPSSGVCSTSPRESSTYGTGSWSGDDCQDTVEVGTEMPAVTINFGGMTSQSQFFEDGDCSSLVTNQATGSPIQGILGLGPLDLDTIGTSNDDAYFNELVQQGITDTMGILLCSSGGALWFGGYDSQYADPSASVQYTPMVDTTQVFGADYWAVSLSGIGLGTTNLGGADPDAIVDTGTGLFAMADSALSALESAMASSSAATTIFGSGALSASFFNSSTIDCIPTLGGQTQADIDAALPPLTLTFPSTNGGSFTLSMPATQSYLVPISANGTTLYCAGTGSGGSGNQQETIIGGPALRAYITIFDEGNSQIGFLHQTACE
jgi:hypothetical protein